MKPEYIAFQKGILDIMNMKFINFDSKFYITATLEVDEPDLKMETPFFDKLCEVWFS